MNIIKLVEETLEHLESVNKTIPAISNDADKIKSLCLTFKGFLLVGRDPSSDILVNLNEEIYTGLEHLQEKIDLHKEIYNMTN